MGEISMYCIFNPEMWVAEYKFKSWGKQVVISESEIPLDWNCCCLFPLYQEEPLDESSVKKMILTFEKRSYKNQELRIKFPDNPEK